MATEAGEISHQFACFPRWLVVRLHSAWHCSGRRERVRTLIQRKQRSRQCVDLLRSEGVLRHLQTRRERARILDLSGNVIGQRVLHAGEEDELRDWFAADAAQLRSEVLRLPDSRDLVAGGATKIRDQPLAMCDLLRRGSIEMNVGQKIRIRLALQEPGER